jgi:hypothetical protein
MRETFAETSLLPDFKASKKVIHMDCGCPTLPERLARYETKIRQKGLPGAAGAGTGRDRSALARGKAVRSGPKAKAMGQTVANQRDDYGF